MFTSKNMKFEKKKTRWNYNLLSYVTNENFLSTAFSFATFSEEKILLISLHFL